MPLSPRRQRFVTEYLADMNATRAAIRAGYSPKTARVQGSDLLTKPDIVAAVETAVAERARRTGVTADRVLQEYARVAFADMRNLTDWGPSGVVVKPAREVSPDDAAAVAELDERTQQYGRSVRVKLHDKVRALDALAKHLGMFVEKHEHAGKGAGPVEHVVRVVRE